MKARVIVTMACNRHCKNCCNKEEVFMQHKVLNDVHDLLTYDEIIITGGEPMLIPDKITLFVRVLRRKLEYEGKIYIYTALFNKDLFSEYKYLFNFINGIHYTVHYESTDQEVMELKLLSQMLKHQHDISSRLAIDSRLYERYDFSNIDFSAWSVVRKLKWQINCKLPEDERLFIYEL
jgi:organic radical activating enzyme